MTKSDFIDWKRHPVTQQVFSQLEARVTEIADQMVSQAGYIDPRMNAYMGGSIAAYKDMLLIDFEEPQ